ncbi:hypothetical protein DIE07_32220 [Burkholderia sp. Bp9002]|nr:hypothetical protein DIE07_32220 [Burkholderia sp. Bp9002]
MAIAALASVAGCGTLEPLPYVELSPDNFAAHKDCVAHPPQPASGEVRTPPFCVRTGDAPAGATQPGVLDIVDKRLFDYTQLQGNTDPQHWQTLNNAIVTVAAVGGIAAAVFAHGAARANWLAGIGLAAGATATTWSWANPVPRSAAYRLGAYRASQLRDASAPFEDTTAYAALDDKKSAVIGEVGDLSTALVDPAFTQALDSPTGATARAATEAKNAAGSSLQDATAALAAADEEEALYRRRSTLVYAALQRIDAQVYASAQGTAITYQDAQKSVNQAVAAAGAAAPAASASQTVESLLPSAMALLAKPVPGQQTAAAESDEAKQAKAIQAVNADVVTLNLDTARLKAMKPFSTAAKAVSDSSSAVPGN